MSSAENKSSGKKKASYPDPICQARDRFIPLNPLPHAPGSILHLFAFYRA